MPYLRHTSPADSPAACSFSALIICSSVNLLLRMSVSRRNGLYPKSRALKGSRSNDMRYPLKIGVHLDMNIERNSNAMDHWTLHPRYLRNIIAGMRRIDLSGETVGDELTEAEKANAFHRLLMVRSDIVSAKGRASGYGYAIG